MRGLLPDAAVTEVIPCTGGQLSTVLEVRRAAPHEPVIVKFYDDRWRWKQQKEAYVYELLRRHGVGPVPAVLHTQEAVTPDAVTPDETTRNAVTVLSMMPGQPLSAVVGGLDTATVRALYRELGACLAAVHRIPQDAYGYITTRIVDAAPSNSAFMLGRFAARLREFGELGGDAELLAAAEAKVAEQGGLLADCPHAVLCHNDFHEGNVLVERDTERGWRVTGFVDVENATAADPLLDLAKTEYYSVRGDAKKWRALIEGYGPLPPGWSGRLDLYRLYHALELWDWFASTGRTDRLPGIAADIRAMTAA